MLPNRYDFREAEPRLARFWEQKNVYGYDPAGSASTSRSIPLHRPSQDSCTLVTAIPTHRRM